MCTCINLKTKDNYFGRNLDLEYRFYEKVVVTPRNYEFKLKAESTFKTKYAMIGMATVVDNYPLYADATNEKGLSIAALNFPNNAYYNQVEEGKINITPFELIPWNQQTAPVLFCIFLCNLYRFFLLLYFFD